MVSDQLLKLASQLPTSASVVSDLKPVAQVYVQPHITPQYMCSHVASSLSYPVLCLGCPCSTAQQGDHALISCRNACQLLVCKPLAVISLGNLSPRYLHEAWIITCMHAVGVLNRCWSWPVPTVLKGPLALNLMRCLQSFGEQLRSASGSSSMGTMPVHCRLCSQCINPMKHQCSQWHRCYA
jgi:hypothetical protein